MFIISKYLTYTMLNWKISENEYRVIATFNLFVIGTISLLSGILMYYSWKRIFIEKEIRLGVSERERDYGLRHIAYALFTWTISSAIALLWGNPRSNVADNNPTMMFIDIALSTVNSLYFILAATYLQFAPKWVKELRKISVRKYLLFISCGIILLISFALAEFNKQHNHLLIQLPDFIISISTVAILLYSLGATFRERNLKALSFFSGFILLIILICQPFSRYLIPNKDGTYYYSYIGLLSLLGIVSKICLIIIFSQISLSWAIGQNKMTEQTVNSLSYLLYSKDEKSIIPLADDIHNFIGSYITQIRNSKEFESMRAKQPSTYTWLDHRLSELDNIKKQLCYGIMPPILKAIGVVNAIKTYVEDDDTLVHNEHVNFIFIEMPSKSEIDVPDAKKLLIYSIVVELINNIMKYANGNKNSSDYKEKVDAKITTFCDENWIKIIVEDYGVGFDDQSPEWQAKCRGLSANKARVMNCGGTFNVTSKRNEFTSVIMTIPNNK